MVATLARNIPCSTKACREPATQEWVHSLDDRIGTGRFLCGWCSHIRSESLNGTYRYLKAPDVVARLKNADPWEDIQREDIPREDIPWEDIQ